MTNPHDLAQLEDELLILDWQDGRAEAFDQIVGRWQRRLWQHARRLTDSDDAAGDVVQDAWLGMMRTIGRLDDPRRFKYWAYRIVTNKSCDWVRRRQRHRMEPLADETQIVDRHSEANETVEQQEEAAMLLAGLSVEHRAVISLRYVEEFSIRQIAETLQLAEGTVKSRLHYAIGILKKRIR